ncbi:MAG: tetratricopeptide repeat protein, partial [Saprospiraceae bacterium]
MPSVKTVPGAPPSPAYLRRLCAHLERSIFTDFEQARAALRELAEAVHPGLPFDIRLAYHRSAAFLENQWQRWEPALEHAHQAIAILENLADAPALAEMWAGVSAVQVNQRAWSAAQESLDRAHHYLDPASPPRVRANVTCREGFLHLHLGNLNQALACFQEAEKDLMGLDASAERKDFYLLTLVLSGLGTLYERLGDKEKSLDAFRRVLPIAEEHRLRPRLPWHFLHTGRVALALDNVPQAREYFEYALRFAGEGEEEVKTHALGNLGILAFLADRPDEAFSLFAQAAA